MPANFTKKAIIEAFLTLVAKKPLSKITVKDIVDECGINRNTFYYHFQDIYALVDEYFLSEAEDMLKSVKDGKSWTDVFIDFAEGLEKERSIVMNFYRNLGKEQFGKYLNTISESFISRMLHSMNGSEQLSDADKKLICSFYSHAFCGVCFEWLEGGMKENGRAFVLRLKNIFEPSLKASLIAAISNETVK